MLRVRFRYRDAFPDEIETSSRPRRRGVHLVGVAFLELVNGIRQKAPNRMTLRLISHFHGPPETARAVL